MTSGDGNSSDKEHLRSLWTLASVRPVVPGRLRAIPVASARAGVDATVSPEGFRGVMLVLRSDEMVAVGKALHPGQGGAIAAEIARFGEGKTADRSLHVWCRDPQCDDAFGMFCQLFLSRLEQMELGSALAQCYEEFKRMLDGAEPDPLGLVVGVIGELLLLRDAVTAHGSDAFDFWAGPRGERHDFRHGNTAVEVKTLLRAQSKSLKVHIANIDQLDAPPGGDLFLHVVGLERVEKGPISVSALIAEISPRLDARASALLLANLKQLGVGSGEGSPSFSIMSRTTYEVRLDFPRLTLAHLKSGRCEPGVSNVSYDLNLDAAREFEVSSEDSIAALINATSIK